MTGIDFGVRLSATNAMEGPMRAAAASVARFTRAVSKPLLIPVKLGGDLVKGLGQFGLAHLGFQKLSSTLNDVVERGARAEVVMKSFTSLTKVGAEAAARSIQAAANGTLRMVESMEIFNRGISGGLSMSQLRTATDFISKKAVTTGKNAGDALNTVITGLSRGSTLFLDDFGILVDGSEGVKRTYDAIKGSGAFDSLGAAAQKAETVRQAVAEMGQQMANMGVNGRETIFVWQRIKTGIGDALDQLSLTLVQSKAMQQLLRGARDLAAGIAKYFKDGGTIGGLLKSVGNVAMAFLTDVGESIGRGFMAAMSGAKAIAIEWGTALWDTIAPKLSKLIEPISQTLTAAWSAMKPIVDALAAKMEQIKHLIDWVSDQLGFKEPGALGIKGVTRGDETRVGLGVAAVTALAAAKTAKVATAARAAKDMGGGIMRQTLEKAAEEMGWSNAAKGAGKFSKWLAPLGKVARIAGKVAGPVAVLDAALTAREMGNTLESGAATEQSIEASRSREEANQHAVRRARQRATLKRQPGPMGGGTGRFSILNQVGPMLMSAAMGEGPAQSIWNFSRTLSAAGDFMGKFGMQGGVDKRDLAAQRADAYQRAASASNVQLTVFGRQAQRRILQFGADKLKLIREGGLGTRQSALEDTGKELDELRRRGVRITPKLRHEIFERNLENKKEALREKLRGPMRAAREILAGDDDTRKIGGAVQLLKDQAAGGASVEVQQKLMEEVHKLVSSVDRFMAALMGAGNDVARAN